MYAQPLFPPAQGANNPVAEMAPKPKMVPEASPHPWPVTWVVGMLRCPSPRLTQRPCPLEDMQQKDGTSHPQSLPEMVGKVPPVLKDKPAVCEVDITTSKRKYPWLSCPTLEALTHRR